MQNNKKFFISGIKEYIDEVFDEDNIYHKYGIYLAESGAPFDKELFNDKISLINFLKKQRMEFKTKNKKNGLVKNPKENDYC